jgi:hypothetical protein
MEEAGYLETGKMCASQHGINFPEAILLEVNYVNRNSVLPKTCLASFV